MKKKSLIMALLGCMVCLAMICFGVYAVSFAKLNTTGELEFVNYDKFIYVEQLTVKNHVVSDGQGGYLAKDTVVDDFTKLYLDQTASAKTLNLNHYKVMKGEDIIIEIKLRSLYADYDLAVSGTNSAVDGVTVEYSDAVLH